MGAHLYHLLHVGGVILLTALTFQAFGAHGPRRRVMMYTGILSVVVLVAGVGLLHTLGLGWPGWVIVKIVCWLGLSAMAGVGFRRPRSAPFLALVTAALVLLAVYMVYWRPF